jgi:hypothetical protein
MSLLADLFGLITRPRATLDRIEGRGGLARGLLGLGLSLALPTLAAELGALGPYGGPSGLGAPSGEIHLISGTFFRWLYQERFVLPLVDLLLGLGLWLLAAALIHWLARRLGGRGSLPGYLAFCGPIALVGLLALPVSLLEAALRAAGQAGAADALAPLSGSIGLLAFGWQNALLVMAARRHYGLSMDRALAAVVGPAAAVAVALAALVVVGTVFLVMALGPTG